MLFEPNSYPLLMHARKNLKNENEVVEADNDDGNPIANIARRQQPYSAEAAVAATTHYQQGFPRVASIPTMFDTLNFGGMMSKTAEDFADPINSVAAVAAAAAFPSSSPPPPKPSLLSFIDPPMMAPIVKPMTPLHPHFTPGEFDVICARGKQAKNHPGNIRYRKHAEKCSGQYSQTNSKMQKSIIVSNIIQAVRSASPNGGFVKFKLGLWYEVGDDYAREKVGQTMRDLLFSRYKSSTEAKRIKRQGLPRSTSGGSASATSTSANASVTSGDEEGDSSGHMDVNPPEGQIDATGKQVVDSFSDSINPSLSFDKSADREWANLFDQSNINMLQAIKTDGSTNLQATSSSMTTATTPWSVPQPVAPPPINMMSGFHEPSSHGHQQEQHQELDHDDGGEEDDDEERERLAFHPPF